MFGASSELASVMEFGFYRRKQLSEHHSQLTMLPFAVCRSVFLLRRLPRLIDTINEALGVAVRTPSGEVEYDRRACRQAGTRRGVNY